MAFGLPDFYRSIDVAKQSLAELTNRPKYGLATYSSGNKTVSSLGRNTLFTVSGKGMIYGGLVFLNYSASQKDAEVIPVVDGNDLVSMQFDDMNLLGVTKVGVYVTTLLAYDETNFIYCVGLGRGITFEMSFALVYNELNAGTPTVFSQIIYSII